LPFARRLASRSALRFTSPSPLRPFSTPAVLPPSLFSEPLSQTDAEALSECLKAHKLVPEDVAQSEVDVITFHGNKYLVIGVDYDEAKERFDPANINIDDAIKGRDNYDTISEKLAVYEATQKKYMSDVVKDFFTREHPKTHLRGPKDSIGGFYKSVVYDQFAMGNIQWFKGDNFKEKCNRMIASMGIFSYLLANQYYPLIEEGLELMLMFTSYLIIKKAFLPGNLPWVYEFFANPAATAISNMRIRYAAEGHNANVFKTYTLFGKMNDELFSMIKQNLVEESSLLEMREKNQKLSSVKSILDRRARQDIEKRRQERIILLNTVHRRVMERIQTPQFQEAILDQCLADLKNLAKKQKA